MQENQSVSRKQKSRQPRHILQRLSKGGADLIDILMSTVLIAGILTAVFAAAGTYKHIRRSSLNTIATKIASADIENIRKLPYADIPNSATLTSNDYPDIAKLPSSNVTRTVSNYDPPGCNPACGSQDIKKISLSVNWNEKGLARQISMETVIYKYGILKN